MNRVVVLGAIIVAVVVAIIAVGILMANHQNNNYTPTSTMTNKGTNIIPNTNIPYNTFYFLNKTNSSYYYIFVFSYNEYRQVTQGIPNVKIYGVQVDGQYAIITKTIVVGNYMFLIGYISSPLNVTIGQLYPVVIYSNLANDHSYLLTYEGNWTGPVP
jgi:hypothetical protein